jgi:hypothetical protein
MWELVPLFVKRSWRGIEELAAMRFQSVEHLHRELALLSTHVPEFNISTEMRRHLQMLFAKAMHVGISDGTGLREENDTVSLFSLEGRPEYDDADLDTVTASHMFMKSRREEAPVASFAGGPAHGKPLIYFFDRPLAESDFMDLWSGSLRLRRHKNGTRGTG